MGKSFAMVTGLLMIALQTASRTYLIQINESGTYATPFTDENGEQLVALPVAITHDESGSIVATPLMTNTTSGGIEAQPGFNAQAGSIVFEDRTGTQGSFVGPTFEYLNGVFRYSAGLLKQVSGNYTEKEMSGTMGVLGFGGYF